MWLCELTGELAGKNCGTAEDVLKKDKPGAVRLFIDSPGGDVMAGMRVVAAMERRRALFPGEPLEIQVGAMACSMAANILALAPAGVRITGHKSSSVMFHTARGFAGGTPAELAGVAQYMRGVNNRVAAALAQRTGKPIEEFLKWFEDGGDHWLTGCECLELGIFDGETGGECPPVKMESLAALYRGIAAERRLAAKEEDMDKDEEKTLPQDPAAPAEPQEPAAPQAQEPAPVEEVREALKALKADIDELKEEVAAMKAKAPAAVLKGDGGMKLDASAAPAAATGWLELVKGIPGDISPRQYALRYAELRESHPVAYAQYMKAHRAR